MSLMTWAKCVAELFRSRATQRTEESPGDPGAAVFAYCADLLEAEADGFANTVLSMSEAANESGYSSAHLRDLARDGVLPLVEGPGPMQVRRVHLPRKPGLGVENGLLSPAARGLAGRVAEGRRK